MELVERTQPYLPRLLTGKGERVAVVFSDRNGGVSDPPYDSLNLALRVGDDEGAVWENRIRVAKAAGFEADSVALARQVHSDGVIEVEPGARGVVGESDVLVTEIGGRTGGRMGGSVIGILTADCAPVVVEGPDRVGVIHAGWRGIVAGAVEAGVAAVGDAQRAWIGPSIHACCYEVGPEVIDAFRRKDLPTYEDRVDPARAAAELLRRAGIDDIVVSDDCTACEERYFSYRRDGTTGRQGAFAWVPS